MLNYLEKLRQRPEAERRKKVLGISVGVTLAIALVWGVFMVMRITGTNFSFIDKAPADMPNLGQTFSNIAETMSGIMQNAATFSNQATSTATTTYAVPEATTTTGF